MIRAVDFVAPQSGVNLIVFPGWVCAGIFHKFLRCVVVPAQEQQQVAVESVPGRRHAVLKSSLFLVAFVRGDAGQSNFLYQATDSRPGDLATHKFQPKLFLHQALAVVVLDLGARQAGLGAHPGVEQAQAADARVMGFAAIEQRGRCAVAQAPQGHLPDGGYALLQRLARGGAVDTDRHEIALVTAAVAHAPVVEAQHRVASAGQCARQQDELPVAADPVLRAAHDDDHPGLRRPFRSGQNAQQRVAFTGEEGGLFGVGHVKVILRKMDDTDAMYPAFQGESQMLPSLVLQTYREAIRKIALSHRVTNVRVFGSAVRGDDVEGSDLDILVDPLSATTMMDIARIEHELVQLLKIPVDVLTPNALPTKFRDQVIAQAQVL